MTRGRSGKKADERHDELSENYKAESSSTGAHKPYELAPSKTSSRGKTKSKSPTKRSVREMVQSVSNVEVDLPFLEQCKPSTKLRSYSYVIDEKKIPSLVKDLWWKVKGVDGVLPRQLMVCYYLYALVLHDDLPRRIDRTFTMHRRILHRKEALPQSAATLPKTLTYTPKKVLLVYGDLWKTLSVQQDAR